MTPKSGSVWEGMTRAEITELLLARVNMLRGLHGEILTEAYRKALMDFAKFVNDGTLPER